jgi:hypothetical protein
MIVVEVGVKTQCKIYGCRSTLKKHRNDSDSDKTDSSHESGKNVITWACPTSTTII